MSARATTVPATLPSVLQSTSGHSPLHASSPNPSRRRTVEWIAGGLFVVLVIGVGGYLYSARPKANRNDLLYHRVHVEPLALTVVERGALESADNRDVICRVRAGTKATNLTIKWVVDDGAFVKQGQLLVEIDDSALQDQSKVQKIVLDTALANRVQAEENYKIVVSQADSDIETTRVNLQLAEIDLKKYVEGEYLAEKKRLEGLVKLAQSDVALQGERVSYTERMVKMKYLSPAQLEAERSKMQGYEVTLKKNEEDQRVLENFTKQREITDRTNKVEEAKRALERNKSQAKAKIAQAESERLTKRSIFEQEEDKYTDIEEQINNCRIYAPQEGLVVYFVSEQSRFGSGSQQSIVAVGEPVKEGQRLMRIPDLRHMLVNTKIHEAMISRVKGDVWQNTGFTDALRAGLLSMPDALGRITSQFAVHDAKDALHNLDHRKIQDGHKASIRIDAFSDRLLPGHVRSVATVASQQDWMSADVKVYQTMISIDESVDGLKPGMSAECTIQIEGVEDVLALPLQAIIGGAELGAKRKCYVKTPDGPKEREIDVGLANEKMAEVRSGLEEGDEVVLNPKVLVGDKVKVRTVDEDRPGMPNGEGKKRGKGKGGMMKSGPPLATSETK